LSEAEKKKGLTFQSPEVRNRFAVQGKNRIQETRPASLYLKDDAELLTVGNFEDHLSWVSEADWIIEVVIEDLNLKRELFKKIGSDLIKRPDKINGHRAFGKRSR
jgi:3-hydroxyacyl-CoA dehydrogenase